MSQKRPQRRCTLRGSTKFAPITPEGEHDEHDRHRSRHSPGRTSAWRELCARVGFPAPTDPAPFSVERAPMRLDVCDEPMAAQSGWTIGVLESLPDGEELLHINTGVPWALLAMLETRGYLYRIDQREPGDVRIRIRRHGAPVSRWDERTR